MIEKNFNFFFNPVSKVKGIGPKIKKLFNEKKIDTNIDLIFNFPYGLIDRTHCPKLNNLEIGKISTIFVKVKKHNFPRIRRLPNTVQCYDETGEINIVFFNSRENYIKEILPINGEVIVSGKVNFYKNKYQITNPDYVTSTNNEEKVTKIMPTYASLKGISNKTVNKIYENIIKDIPDVPEWHRDHIIKNNNWLSFKHSLVQLHNPKKIEDLDKNSLAYERISFDEIFSNLLIFAQIKKKIANVYKKPKIFSSDLKLKLIKNLSFTLTKDQEAIIKEIDDSLKSNKKMIRLLQGDVGSGKTIISIITGLNVIAAGYQVALMCPTEILATQHLNLIKSLTKEQNINVEILSSGINKKRQIEIKKEVLEGKINFLIGTHSLFQETVSFFNLGLIIIDEQHKFGVKQRISLSDKGGENCDVLLMSATPIPRTLILSTYGDMDISTLKEKPFKKTTIITNIIPENKIPDLINLIKKKIESKQQIYWICPLIEESKKVNLTPVLERFKYLTKYFPENVIVMHGNLKNEEKNIVMKNFLEKKFSILISTTVVEVGVDNPNANMIIIENSERFGLAQLHQLRGRVGRGIENGECILVYSKSISENGKKRLKILKESNDGFYISEQDLKLRGFGDIIGYKQSGQKDFIVADPMYHSHLFELAKQETDFYTQANLSLEKFNVLLKFFKKDKILNIIDSG
ncbi:MAG: ATP-dependent DNA helicase RecG [Candidatus Fonsibacter ubiquis]|jgi:ATP-dependent DNA helicase RecG|nr:ATP-dependent DNA helicase RecG [Candidatus Fonsibacter ubiquis]NCW70753.1 ATP-dependent DNA helicase RecG [Pseudomonadota bacterium]NCU53927.1 ATP-dependent DNA helicase RecG [Candidatus Fonsibacter ubiquis]NCU68048.1 ATP-dependent DNA helicase RecG [Candidatus Fonsibacter ubiquis]NCU68980.1 ATP-dependent DNA helicase RecG [Candidatus Fonsibacter ubiquis]